MTMSDSMNTYEAMFLLSQQVAVDFGDAIEHINELFNRAGAEVLAMQKWDERRLAYEIKKQRRGVYILAYFKVDPQNLPGLERDSNISDKIMRMMVVKADQYSPEEIQSFDRRDELVGEVKMRAERAAERTESQAARVTLAAERAEQAAAAEAAAKAAQAPAETAPGDSTKAETTPETAPETTPEVVTTEAGPEAGQTKATAETSEA